MFGYLGGGPLGGKRASGRGKVGLPWHALYVPMHPYVHEFVHVCVRVCACLCVPINQPGMTVAKCMSLTIC